MPGPTEPKVQSGQAFAGTPKDLGPTTSGRALSEPSTSGEMIATPQEMNAKPKEKDTAPAAPPSGRKAGDFKGTPENV